MKRMAVFAALLAFCLTSIAAEEKGSPVAIDKGLKSVAPASWEMEKPKSRFRAFQFSLPKAEGDKKDAEMIVYFFGRGGGGGLDANIKRWKGQFADPKVKMKTWKAGDVEATVLDLTGTLLDKFPPFAPNAKVIRRPGYRRINVYFASENGPYFFRFSGPQKTIDKHADEIEKFIKGFKK